MAAVDSSSQLLLPQQSAAIPVPPLAAFDEPHAPAAEAVRSRDGMPSHDIQIPDTMWNVEKSDLPIHSDGIVNQNFGDAENNNESSPLKTNNQTFMCHTSFSS